MKRMLLVLIPVALLSACQPPKPWSPYDSKTDKSGHEPTADSKTSKPTEPVLDIGDAEQGIFVEGKIAKESLMGNIKAQAAQERRKFVQQVMATVTPPIPTEFWVEYAVKCTRNFSGQPVVLRAEVKVNGKPVDKIVTILGAKAEKNTFSKKVNLLAGLTTPPTSMLVTVEGQLIMMPPGTAEESVNTETATSDLISRAIDSTVIRVNFGDAGAATAEAPAAAIPAPATTPATTTPAPATPAPAPAQ